MHSDTDRTRSPSPSAGGSYANKSTLLGYGTTANGFPREIRSAAHTSFGEVYGEHPDHTAQRLILKTRPYRPPGSSPDPARSSSQPPVNIGITHIPGSRRSRPETSHQKAVNIHRKARIERIIHKKVLAEHDNVRHRRANQKRTTVFRAMRRIRDLPDDYTSANEDSWGPGGLLPNNDEDEDYGEEAFALKRVLERARRRLEREENGPSPNGLSTAYLKRKRKPDDYEVDEQSETTSRRRYLSAEDDHHSIRRDEKPNGEAREETLDELDLELLGESRDEEQMDEDMDEESGDDSEDMTEEEDLDGH